MTHEQSASAHEPQVLVSRDDLLELLRPPAIGPADQEPMLLTAIRRAIKELPIVTATGGQYGDLFHQRILQTAAPYRARVLAARAAIRRAIHQTRQHGEVRDRAALSVLPASGPALLEIDETT